MTKTFTKNDLVRFLYDELETEKYDEIKQLLAVDEELKEELMEMSVILNKINQLSFSPSDRSVEKILNYAKNYQESTRI